MSTLMEKIKQNGYWKITIHPNEFKEDRIPSRADLKKIVEDNKVVLRGWDYPHLDQVINNVSRDSIESSCDWEAGPMYEYWRYYQSGLFVHYLILREDYRIDEDKKASIRSNFVFNKDQAEKVDKFLDIIGTLYTLTEIYEFASRIAGNGYLGDDFTIEIELHGVKDRMLFFWNVWRHLNMPYICRFEDDVIIVKRDYTKDDIVQNAHKHALQEAIAIFNDFNWETVNSDIFEEDQKKFLERRI